MYKYKITGTLLKQGGTPTSWIHLSKTKLTKAQCEKMLSQDKIIGLSSEQIVTIINFRCDPLNQLCTYSKINTNTTREKFFL